MDTSGKCPFGAKMDTSQQITLPSREKEPSVEGQRQRGKRESGVWLASPLPWRKTWGAEAGDEAVAGAGEGEQVGAGRSPAPRYGCFPTTTWHDSLSNCGRCQWRLKNPQISALEFSPVGAG